MKRVLSTIIALTSLLQLYANADENIDHIEINRGEAVVLDNIEPTATLTSKSGQYSISISGNINMKASYDFNGSINNPDFITSLISVPGSFDDDRRFYLDATTSRVELKGMAHSELVGDVELCLNMDFRGGSIGSYTPRVRLAYISLKGFVVGRNFTTFCDMGSVAPNIDFQGPNVCPFIYSTQIRYTKPLFDNKVLIGGAIEYQDYQSSTLGDEDPLSPSGQAFCYQDQYAPDLIGYLQYNWREHNNHIRLTGLYKSIPLYNYTLSKDVNLNGWGTQLSGSLGLGRFVKLYYSGTLGEGITNYMQDTYGSGLDVIVSSGNSPTASMTLMYGYQLSALAQLTDRTMVSGGYSIINIEGAKSKFMASDYRQGEYLFANIFYSVTPRIQLSSEYLWGKRTNNDGAHNSANRFYTMIQYSF